jgi:hypothetical protein
MHHLHLPYVLIAWGADAYRKQALLAAASLRARGVREVVIHTDTPEFFLPSFKSEPWSRPTLRALCGPLRFAHRAKIAILRRHLTRHGAPCVYLDADTYCTTPPAITSDQTRPLLHTEDGLVSPEFFPRLHRFLTGNLTLFHRAGFPQITPSFRMFNAGAIYFPQRPGYGGDLREVARLCDLACRHFPMQIEWLEQFAFNQILGAQHPLAAMPAGLTHYWAVNFEVACLLRDMSPASILALAESSEKFTRLLDDARTLAADARHRRKLALRRHRRSLTKRMTLLRAWWWRRTAPAGTASRSKTHQPLVGSPAV